MKSETRLPPAAAPADGWTSSLPELTAAIVPSLAAAVTVSSALWLSAAAIAALFATALVAALVATALVASLVADRLPRAAASFAVLTVAAALACGIDLAASAWLPAVHADLGLYLPLAVTVVSGPVAAAVLRDPEARRRTRRAALRALAVGAAFLGSVGVTALGRELLGAGTLTLTGGNGGRVVVIPGLADAPARALLAPFAGLVAAGYLAGLVTFAVRRAARRAAGGSVG